MKKENWLAQPPLELHDRASTFHDPFSESTLFLSRQLKQQMHHCSNPKQWSPKLQHRLLNAIVPVFQKQFPKHHLGVTTLKKTWEYYQKHTHDAQRQGILTAKGALHIPSFIKENLKNFSQQQHNCLLHPSHYAHQLAVKMGEYIAVIDGIRPKIDQLTKTIWSLQRHLIPTLSKQQFQSAYDERENIDKIIIQSLLDETAKQPECSQAELAFYVEKKLSSLRTFLLEYASAERKIILQALYAEMFHHTTSKMERILEKIPYWVGKLAKKELARKIIDSPHLEQKAIIEQTTSFLHKASSALEGIDEEEIDRKIQIWTHQGEMLLRWVGLNAQSYLLREVEKHWAPRACLQTMHHSICQSYLTTHPPLVPLAQEVALQTWIYIKSLWYTQHREKELSTYDRFLLWQKHWLAPLQLPAPELMEYIEERCKKALPLLPLNKARAHTLLFTENQN